MKTKIEKTIEALKREGLVIKSYSVLEYSGRVGITLEPIGSKMKDYYLPKFLYSYGWTKFHITSEMNHHNGRVSERSHIWIIE